MTVQDRKKLQAVLENALYETGPDNVRFDEETQKRFYLLLLSLIYELNAKDAFTKPGNEEDPCLCQCLREIFIDFSILKVPDIFGPEYLQQFTDLANNLGNLSSEVNRLLLLLNREHAGRILVKIEDNVTKQ